MEKFFFLLQCPACKNNMKYHTTSRILSDKKKRCVYCGRTFIVREHMIGEIK